MATIITSIETIPCAACHGTGRAGIIITSGAPTYFMVAGSELDSIVSFDWYPRNPASVKFKTRQLILVNSSIGTCMVMVTNNYYNACDRGGHLSFKLKDDTVITFPTYTYGQLGKLWTSPFEGIDTG